MKRLSLFHNKFMKEAILYVDINSSDAPIGAIIVDDENKIISRARNNTEHDPSGHAEVLAIRQAVDTLGVKKLYNCSIYVTLEPCPMCATLISYTRLKNLYYGARDLKFGAVESNVKIFESNLSLFKPNIYSGILENECLELLKNHFANKRL